MYLLLKLDVCNTAITGDIKLFKLIILLTLSWSKGMVSLLSSGQVKNNGHFDDIGEVEIIHDMI